MQMEMGEGDAQPKAKPKDKTKGRKRPMFSFQIAEETILWKTIVTVNPNLNETYMLFFNSFYIFA